MPYPHHCLWGGLVSFPHASLKQGALVGDKTKREFARGVCVVCAQGVKDNFPTELRTKGLVVAPVTVVWGHRGGRGGGGLVLSNDSSVQSVL